MSTHEEHIVEIVRQTIGLRLGDEAERLLEEAKALLAIGYKPEELTILSHINQQVSPQVIPTEWIRDHDSEEESDNPEGNGGPSGSRGDGPGGYD